MTHLKGMLQIKNYAQRSESTVLTWIKSYRFPAVKLPESSIWEAYTEHIDEWRENQVKDAVGKDVKRPDVKTAVKRGRRQAKKKK